MAVQGQGEASNGGLEPFPSETPAKQIRRRRSRASMIVNRIYRSDPSRCESALMSLLETSVHRDKPLPVEILDCTQERRTSQIQNPMTRDEAEQEIKDVD